MSTAASQYTKEGATLKNKAKILIESFINQVQSNKSLGLKVKGNEPKMSLRAIRSILLSPDSIYGDILEQALSEGWSGEKLKNKVRTMMEAGAHSTLSPAPHFTLHHTGGSLGSLGPSAQAAKPNVLRQALIEVTERGAKLGESGLIGLPEYAHTGAINQRLKKLGLSNLDTPGISFLNAHLGDQRFTGYNVDAVAGFGSVDDLVKAWWDSGIIPQQMLDAQIGIEAARSELNELTEIAKEFGLDIDKNPGEVQKLLRKNPNLLERVVKAGKSPTIDTVPSFTKRLELGNVPSKVTKYLEELKKDLVNRTPKGSADVGILAKLSGGLIGAVAIKSLLARPDLLDVLTEEQGKNLAQSMGRLEGGENAMTVFREQGLDAALDLGKELVGQVPTLTGLGVASTVFPGAVKAVAPVAGSLAAASIIPASAYMYSGYLKERTGKGLGEHYQAFQDKRRVYGEHNNWGEYKPIGPTIDEEGNPLFTITQGNRQNKAQRFLQEVKSRIAHAKENFDPSRGEWGASEIIYGR